VPRWVLEQLDAAIPQRTAQGSIWPAVLYHKAASLCSRLGDSKRARAYLECACRLGIKPSELKKDRVLQKDAALAKWWHSLETPGLWQPAAVNPLDLSLADPLDSPLP
jgi:hypothetical protein